MDRLEVDSVAGAYSSSSGFHSRGSHLGHWASSDFSALDLRFVVLHVLMCTVYTFCLCFNKTGDSW